MLGHRRQFFRESMSTTAPQPFSLSELSAAYRAAAERQAHRISQGAVITGHKVGFTNTRNWAQLGATEPMWGAMYDDTVTFMAGKPGPYSLARFTGPRIEPEIVLHFHKAPPTDASPEQILARRSEQHTSELQSREKLVCRLLLEKK